MTMANQWEELVCHAQLSTNGRVQSCIKAQGFSPPPSSLPSPLPFPPPPSTSTPCPSPWAHHISLSLSLSPLAVMNENLLVSHSVRLAHTDIRRPNNKLCGQTFCTHTLHTHTHTHTHTHSFTGTKAGNTRTHICTERFFRLGPFVRSVIYLPTNNGPGHVYSD